MQITDDRRANKAVAALLSAVLALGVCGCTRPMLSRYSSLRPKTASLNYTSDTIRSQNGDSPTPWTSPLYKSPQDQPVDNIQAAANVSSPSARLLTPQFGPAGNVRSQPAPVKPTNDRNESQTDGLPITAARSITAEPISNSNTGNANGTSGHSIGFNADNVRQYLNSQSRSAMSEGDLLPDRQEKWQVLSTNAEAIKTADGLASGRLESSVEPFQSAEVAQQPGAQPSMNVLPQFQPTDLDNPIGVQPEPSMLERLKEFYGPDGESSARQILRRNLQKIPSPFSVFRERDRVPALVTPELPPSMDPEDEVPPPVATTNQSESNLLVARLIETVNLELQSWPQQLNGSPQNSSAFQRRQQDLQLLYLIANQPNAAIASLNALPPGEQAFWQELMLAMAQYRTDEDNDRDTRLSLTAQQLRSAARHLSVFADLEMKRLDICSRIDSFGRVESFPSNDFSPGDPILLYAEIDNFSAEVTDNGTYRTNFDAQLQILHDNDSEPIETIELSDISDEATSQRTDYFQSFELTIPSHLATGRYRIRVRLRDLVSRKTAEGLVEFQVR